MPEPARLSVVGEGTVDGVADRCIIHAALNVMADTVADAVSRVGLLSSQVSESLKTTGLAPADLRTTGLSVQDFFDQSKQKVTARVASYQLKITIRQLSKLDDHIAGLVAVAGDSLQIRSLQLTVADPEPLKRDARVAAMQDACTKAAELAEAAGGRLGRILSIDEGSLATDPPYRGFATRASGSVATHLQVELGSLTVSSTVAVTYELSD
jgi:uncharacterized protein YggE